MDLVDTNIYCIRNTTFSSNTYILKEEATNLCLVIDPGLDPEIIDSALSTSGLLPVGIISTHGHFDHIGGVSFLKEKYNVPFYLHEADLKICKSANFYLKVAGINKKFATPIPDHLLTGKSGNFTIGNFILIYYNFPGHSNGSCIVQYNNTLFSGDIFYKNGLGFNSFPGENTNTLADSITRIFNTFPESNFILPGHGQAVTLGEIKNGNKELQAFLNRRSS